MASPAVGARRVWHLVIPILNPRKLAADVGQAAGLAAMLGE
jgi:hypothetical protein